jgi:hypothetical protein
MSLYPPCSVFGPQVILDQAGNPISSQSCTIYKADGSTVATLYTDNTGNTGAANPTTTDVNGNLVFFVAAAGTYVIATVIAGVSTAVTVYVDSFPGIQPFGFVTGGGVLVGSLPAGPDLPNWYALEWNTVITIGTDGLDIANAFPVAFPHAVCTFEITPDAATNGSAGMMYLVNPYDVASWTLSNFKVSAVGISGFRNASLALVQLAGASTIACSVRALGC